MQYLGHRILCVPRYAVRAAQQQVHLCRAGQDQHVALGAAEPAPLRHDRVQRADRFGKRVADVSGHSGGGFQPARGTHPSGDAGQLCGGSNRKLITISQLANRPPDSSSPSSPKPACQLRDRSLSLLSSSA
jgi:hypothetical protein